jgi:hypothetical protein
MRIKTWKLVYLPNKNGANMQRRSYQAFASNLYEITSIPYQGSNLTIVDSPLKKNISKGIWTWTNCMNYICLIVSQKK